MSFFDIAILGFGVVGAQSLNALIKFKPKKKIKKINIAIIEKDLSNIPGGVAYSKIKSKFGFFNNPLRLSDKEFINWAKKKNNIKKLEKFIKNNKNYNLCDWLKKNKKNFTNKNISEVYFPRLFYSIYLEEIIFLFLAKAEKLNINLSFFKGEVKQIDKKNKTLIPKNRFKKITFTEKNKNLLKHECNSYLNQIAFKNLIISTGILPPDIIKTEGAKTNNNYVWDFYSEGGTENLLSKIKKIKKKNITIVFIGNKAGLLETMQTLEKIINKNQLNLNIISISNSNLTLQKAILSKNYKNYKFKFLTKKNFQKSNFAKDILNLLKLEFENAKIKNFYHYDVWTKVLKKNVLNTFFAKLNVSEKEKYLKNIFPEIRNITRYTYPDTVIAKEKIEVLKKFKHIKSKVIKIIKYKKMIRVVTKNKLNIKCDILINVSGPLNLMKKNYNSKLLDSLKTVSNKFNERGFYTKSSHLKHGIYLPGALSYNFNPLRETIIKAITKNAHNSIKKILAI